MPYKVLWKKRIITLCLTQSSSFYSSYIPKTIHLLYQKLLDISGFKQSVICKNVLSHSEKLQTKNRLICHIIKCKITKGYLLFAIIFPKIFKKLRNFIKVHSVAIEVSIAFQAAKDMSPTLQKRLFGYVGCWISRFSWVYDV